MKDYYELLGVSKTATAQEIKSAYRKMALQWHPDRNKSPEATEKFKEINAAYGVISDPAKRQQYDQIGHSNYTRTGGAGFGSQGGGGAQYGPFSYSTGGQNGDFDFGNMDPFDIFEQFFGFRTPENGQRRQRRAVYEMQLTFEEAVKGVEKKTVIEGKEKSIKVPAGVDDGMRIRFAEFDVMVHVRPHATFKREGQDVYLEEKITIPQAVLGDVVEVKTIDEKVKLKVRPGTQSGTVVRLKGKGIPYPNRKERGDQYVIFQVNIPEHISSEVKKLMEQLKKEL